MADPAASLELLKDIQSRCRSRTAMKDLEIDKLRIDNFSQAEGTSSQQWLSTFLVDQSVGVGLCKGCEEVFKLDMRGKRSNHWTTSMMQHATTTCPTLRPSHSKFVSPLTAKMSDPAASLELLKDIQSRCWSRKGMKDLEIGKLRIDNFCQAEGTSSQQWLSTFLVDQSVGVGLCKGCEEVFKLDMRSKKSSWSWTTGMKQHANQTCPQKPPQRLPLQE